MQKSVVAFITGGAGSLGLATARKLASQGSKVVLFDLPTSKGKALAEEIGENAKFAPGDITSEEDVEKAFELTKSQFGKLNLVVNCAGTTMSRVIYNHHKNSMIQLDDIRKFFEVNLVGLINVIRFGVDLMAKNRMDEDGLRGLIINTSGFAAHDGQTGHVMAAGSWGGISSMTLPLCRDLSPLGIRVVTISPGLIDSKLTYVLPKKLLEHLTVTVPSPKRLGKPEEYADLVVAILQNSYLNGSVIRLDGGLRFFLH